MAKRTKNKIKTLFVSVLAMIVGVVFGFIANIAYVMPNSYVIPAKKQISANVDVLGEINANTVASSDLSIHFLELGNQYTGDCTLIKVGNTEMLIDAGSKANSISAIKTYIDNYCTDGILEYVVVTHAHEDHYAGFATNEGTKSLFDHYIVNQIIDFGNATNKTTDNKMFANYKRELEEETQEGAKYNTAIDCVNSQNGANREYFLDQNKNIYFEILYQYYYDHQTSDENDYSVCLQVVHGEKKFLFTGDLEKDGEESLVDSPLNAGRLGKVELFKAGHHGSKTSTSTKLLQVINPEVVCVCCCAGSNQYTSNKLNQFPTQDFINRVYSNNPLTQIYVTTLCLDFDNMEFESFNGNIVLLSTGVSDVSMMFSKSSTELRDTDWFKQNRTLPAS